MNEEQEGAVVAESLLDTLGMDALPITPNSVVQAVSCPRFKLVLEKHSFSNGILGKAIGNSNAAVIYINKNIPNQNRYNFTAAHEIGHVCMHIAVGKKSAFECGDREMSSSSPHEDPLEKQANGFASGLLMPRALIKPLTDGEITWANIQVIADRCASSLEASYRRISNLSRAPSAMIIHRDSGASFARFIASDNFGFYIKREPLSYDQKMLSVDVKLDRAPDTSETMDASDWINPTIKGITLGTIYASTISLENGFLYTLLTYDDDCIEDDYGDYS